MNHSLTGQKEVALPTYFFWVFILYYTLSSTLLHSLERTFRYVTPKTVFIGSYSRPRFQLTNFYLNFPISKFLAWCRNIIKCPDASLPMNHLFGTSYRKYECGFTYNVVYNFLQLFQIVSVGLLWLTQP